VHAASKRQYTAEGGEIQVSWAWTVFTSDRRRNRGLIHRLANAVLHEPYRSVFTKRELNAANQTP